MGYIFCPLAPCGRYAAEEQTGEREPQEYGSFPADAMSAEELKKEIQTMALTRKALKAMGLTDEQMDSVIELHTETIDGLKTQRDGYKADADKLAEAQAELETLRKDGYKAKYEKEHSEFETFKNAVTAKETKAAKTAAVRRFFEDAGITGKSLEIAMRGAGAEIEAVELDGDKLKDTAALDALVKGDFAGLIGTTTVKGAEVNHPPKNNPAEVAPQSLADALKAKYKTETRN